MTLDAFHDTRDGIDGELDQRPIKKRIGQVDDVTPKSNS
jgi:hypothetical protein